MSLKYIISSLTELFRSSFFGGFANSAHNLLLVDYFTKSTNRRNIKIILSRHLPLFIFSWCLLTGCSDFVEGYEEDPNNASDAPIEAVLNAAFTGMIVSHEGEDARLACMWSRQFSGSDRQYSGYQVYNLNSEAFEWDKYYLAIENAEITIEKAAASSNKLASGIAKIIKAHSIGMVTSLWGDIPFTQANRFPEIEDPVFDSQAEVYGGVQDLLDEGITDLKDNPSNTAIENIDFFFGGDPAAWIAVAQTLKARFYLHVGDYANAITAANAGLTSTSQNLMAPHTGGAYNQDMNLYHSFGILDREGYMTANDAILPTLLDANEDSYRGNSKTDESGRFARLFTGSAGTYDLNYNAYWAADAPFPLVTAEENWLIIAESRLGENSDMQGALDALNSLREIYNDQWIEYTTDGDGNIIDSANYYLAYDLADFDNGGIAAVEGKSAKDALMYEIMEEKYVTLVGQAEVFNDLRRTNNILDFSPTTGSTFPQRFLVPQVEIDANSNVPRPLPGLFDPTPVNQ